MNTKVVINKQYGGFSLSNEAIELYKELSGNKNVSHKGINLTRTDPFLVKVVETLGYKADGRYADLCIEEIPAEFIECFEIEEYDGIESINLSPHLLISHRLKQIDVIEGLTDKQCKELLTELWHINNK